MKSTTREWLEGLRHRAAEELPGVTTVLCERPAAEAAAERMILAAQFSSTLESFGDVIDARRRWLETESLDGDHDPAIVVTTSGIGATVLDELMAIGDAGRRSHSRAVVAVSERVYRLWSIAHPDPAYRLHVNLWNWIKTRVPKQRHAEFVEYPIQATEAYWLHRAGVTGAGSANRRDCHLWKWTGQQVVLLKAFVTERSVGRLGGAEDD